MRPSSRLQKLLVGVSAPLLALACTGIAGAGDSPAPLRIEVDLDSDCISGATWSSDSSFTVSVTRGGALVWEQTGVPLNPPDMWSVCLPNEPSYDLVGGEVVTVTGEGSDQAASMTVTGLVVYEADAETDTVRGVTSDPTTRPRRPSSSGSRPGWRTARRSP